jgi:PEP-CTERM motif
MRKSSFALLAGLLAIGLSGQAQAAPLAFTGSLGIQVASLDPISITGSGVAEVGSTVAHIDSITFGPDIFSVAGVVVPVTDPAAAPIKGVQATVANAAASFSGSPLGGPMGIVGVAKVCLFAACTSAPPANVSVPLDVVGVGGSKSVAMFVNVTVTGNPWTTGVVTIMTGMGGTASAAGFAHGPASGTSSTAALSGIVRLVTPVLVSTNIGASAIVPTFGLLTLHFVPEPGTLVLLGSGIAGLVAFGRSRRA